MKLPDQFTICVLCRGLVRGLQGVEPAAACTLSLSAFRLLGANGFGKSHVRVQTKPARNHADLCKNVSRRFAQSLTIALQR
jgi:hypothetical protein